MARRIIDDIGDRLPQESRICVHVDGGAVIVEFDRAGVEAPHLDDVPADELADLDPVEPEFEQLRLQSDLREEIIRHLNDLVGVLRNGLGEFALDGIEWARALVKEKFGRAPNDGQGRAQFVEEDARALDLLLVEFSYSLEFGTSALQGIAGDDGEGGVHGERHEGARRDPPAHHRRLPPKGFLKSY